jgi:hypothetical protein
LCYNLCMEKLEQTTNNTEINEIKNETAEPEKDIIKASETTQDDINNEITKRKESINDTESRISDIRAELGLEASNQTPPSVQHHQESIDKLNEEKSKLETFNFKIIEPLPEETPEEYISRSMTSIIDEYINKDSELNNTPRLIKKIYYGRHSHQAMAKFYSVSENSKKVKNFLFQLEVNENKKFSENKNSESLDNLNRKISSSNKELAVGEDDKKREYYFNTNQVREFFSVGRKFDAYSYASMMFGLPENFINTEEGKDYLHSQLDDKTIFLFGGGDSIKDLLKSEEFKPKKVINFDPYLKEETFDKNPNGIYESQMISASDKKIREMTENNELPKADEVWATYSVPFYLDSPEDIKELIENMTSVLNEGGNARISPIAVQNIEKDDENFETRKQALLDSLKTLLDSPDYNVTVFNDTLKIHKIKKESNNT